MLDDIDKKLINLLAKDSRLTYTELSRAVHLSRPSVAERINRFIDQKVIEKFSTIFSLPKIGRPICVFIHISNIKLSVDGMLQLLDRDEIIEVYSVTGENNFIAKAATASLPGMEELLKDLMPHCKVVTSIVISRHDNDRPLVK